MTKQEKIKKGLIEITKSRPMTYQILRWLRDEGVVIKAGRNLPDIFIYDTQGDMTKIGYVAVESLIDD